MLAAAQVTLDPIWIVATAFLVAMGTAIWKVIPWIIRSALEDAIASTVGPDIAKINDRIDSHMENEENSLDDMNESVTAIFAQLADRSTQAQVEAVRDQLDERTQLFTDIQETLNANKEILQHHIDDDRTQFAAAGQSLVTGQMKLDEKLASIERSLAVHASLDARLAAIEAALGINQRQTETIARTTALLTDKEPTNAD